MPRLSPTFWLLVAIVISIIILVVVPLSAPAVSVIQDAQALAPLSRSYAVSYHTCSYPLTHFLHLPSLPNVPFFLAGRGRHKGERQALCCHAGARAVSTNGGRAPCSSPRRAANLDRRWLSFAELCRRLWRLSAELLEAAGQPSAGVCHEPRPLCARY